MSELAAKFDQAMTNVMNARVRLLDVQDKKIAAKEDLKDQEATLIVYGSYTASGKNEKEREAYLRVACGPQRAALQRLEQSERFEAMNLEISMDTRRNLESILKIMELEAI